LAYRRAITVAANAVGTDTARAFRTRRTCLPIDFVDARALPITRAGPGTRVRRIVILLPRRDIRARADTPGQVASFAGRSARAIAAYAVDTIAARTFGARGTRSARVLFAGTIAIAYRSARLIARSIRQFGRIRRHAHRVADILGALIAVDRDVRHSQGRHDVSLTIAFDDLAVAGRLSHGQIRARSREVKSALLIDARTRLAKIVRPLALTRGVTDNAHTPGITDEALATDRIYGLDGIHRHSRNAQIFRTRIVVLRHIRVVILDGRSARSVAYDAPTIARLLHRQWCPRIRE